MKWPAERGKPMSSEDLYSETRDAAEVRDALDLAGEPAFVEMVGRNVKFVIPGGGDE